MFLMLSSPKDNYFFLFPSPTSSFPFPFPVKSCQFRAFCSRKFGNRNSYRTASRKQELSLEEQRKLQHLFSKRLKRFNIRRSKAIFCMWWELKRCVKSMFERMQTGPGKMEFHCRETLNTLIIVPTKKQATCWSLTPRIFLWHFEHSGAKNFS